jgi:hypothetical protein
MTIAAEALEEQILAAMTTRLEGITLDTVPTPWYVPRFVKRTYQPLDAVNELPGYMVLRAPEESGAEPMTTDPSGTVLATMGVEVLAYGAGSETDPADRVLLRLLAQAERALLVEDLLGATSDTYTDIQNTRRVLDHETEVGAPWRSLMSHLYRVRFTYSRGVEA